MVAICSFRTMRNSSSLNAVVPRISRFVLCAFFFSSRSTTFCSRARSSGRFTSTGLCPQRLGPPITRARASRKIARPISMESNEVFHLTAKISPNSNVADKHPILVNFEPGRGLLASSARVDRADVDLQTIENGVALRRLAFFENLAVKLLHQQHGGATGQHVSASS